MPSCLCGYFLPVELDAKLDLTRIKRFRRSSKSVDRLSDVIRCDSSIYCYRSEIKIRPIEQVKHFSDQFESVTAPIEVFRNAQINLEETVCAAEISRHIAGTFGWWKSEGIVRPKIGPVIGTKSIVIVIFIDAKIDRNSGRGPDNRPDLESRRQIIDAAERKHVALIMSSWSSFTGKIGLIIRLGHAEKVRRIFLDLRKRIGCGEQEIIGVPFLHA